MFSGRYMRSVVFTTLAVSIPTLSLQSQPKFTGDNNISVIFLTYCHNDKSLLWTAFCAENSERKLYSDIAVESFRNSLSPASNFERLDVRLLESDHRQWVNNHALHETLKGDGKVEAYEVYRKKDSDEVVCLVIFGESLNGYPKIVHGGITALIFDNTYGWLFMALQKPPAVTANLSVNYR